MASINRVMNLLDAPITIPTGHPVEKSTGRCGVSGCDVCLCGPIERLGTVVIESARRADYWYCGVYGIGEKHVGEVVVAVL